MRHSALTAVIPVLVSMQQPWDLYTLIFPAYVFYYVRIWDECIENGEGLGLNIMRG